jgi:predicted methyltransferase
MKKILVVLMSALALMSIQAQAQSLDVQGLIQQITNDPGRDDADKARDPGRRPITQLNFLGLEEGMTVIDLVAAAGYYTEVLSNVVGPAGKVYMQNSAASLTGNRGERTAAAIDQRLANNRLSNVERVTSDPDDLPLADNSLDAAIIALEFHELYRSDNPNAVADFLAEMRRVLKVGGVLGVIEHAGHPVYDNGELHRALESQVVADAQSAGLFVQASGRNLRNIEDNRSGSIFGASIRGATDRFVLRIIKKR